MDALKISPTILNLQFASSPRAVRAGELFQQLPVAVFQQKLKLPRLVVASYITIWKRGLCIASRSCFTKNILTSKSCQTTTRAHLDGIVIVMQDTAAGECAAALLEIAQSNEMLETINEDMCKLSQLLQNQGLYDFLVKPIFQAEKKKSILKAVADDAKFQTCTLDFLDLLIDNKRIDIIMDIVEEFDSLYNELTGTQVAVVTSAIKLEKHQVVQIAKKIQKLSGATNVRIKNVIDPSLIAGFVISYGKDRNQTIDMSVKKQLEKLAAQIDSADTVGACNQISSVPNGINGGFHKEESPFLSLVGDNRMQAYL